MDNELIKQKILANIEQRKTLWTVEIVLTGGLATILTNMDSLVKLGLFILGSFLFVFIMSGIRHTNKNLLGLYKQMEKK